LIEFSVKSLQKLTQLPLHLAAFMDMTLFVCDIRLIQKVWAFILIESNHKVNKISKTKDVRTNANLAQLRNFRGGKA
jgi:hypothetical protein